MLVVEGEAARIAVFPEHGGHVAEFAPVGFDDLLWLSSKSHFEPGKPIRGGIPICWPWFGAHPSDKSKPSHGFARIAKWTLDGIDETPDGGAKIAMSLSSDDATLALWPHEFKLVCEVVATNTLTVKLTTFNTGDEPLEITEALHSYFGVGDVAEIAVSRLDGARYIDTIDGNAERAQRGDIRFAAEVDRVYLDTTAECVISDPLKKRVIRVAKEGSASTVVWNPWISKAARMPDFGDNEYKDMVCVETTNAWEDARVVAPGESHTISAEISCDALE